MFLRVLVIFAIPCFFLRSGVEGTLKEFIKFSQVEYENIPGNLKFIEFSMILKLT